ncbi:hypothetical protein CcCBS67573_g00498 [Chytriomyces confervae]|uniref:DUF6818 domain-containing protein n=1 Tax=Chytriomyces confervae TaxID=246404 RepID=A0A507FPL0_9FUNG|nr:hypothetical protein CcCBS67573_g00498 [Chytriomyces confervae]
MHRDGKSIKDMFRSLTKHKKPTRDPLCPSPVKWAKRIERDIEAKNDVVDLDDSMDEEEDEDADEEEEEGEDDFADAVGAADPDAEAHSDMDGFDNDVGTVKETSSEKQAPRE